MTRGASLFQLRWLRRFFLGGLGFWLIVPPVEAQVPAPEIREFGIATIESLGQAIFEQDRQAAIASDTLLKQRNDLNLDGIRGWIVAASASGAVVRFVRDRNGRVEAAYDIAVSYTGAPTLSDAQGAPLSAEELSQFAARSLAIQNIDQPCSRRYNTVVLREPGAVNWLVWTLAATTEPNTILVGGHYRFTISSDGQRILAKDRLSRSCLTIGANPSDVAGQTTGAFATHIVSPTPVETHVFLSLLHRTPLYVGVAENQVWLADRGRLRRVK